MITFAFTGFSRRQGRQPLSAHSQFWVGLGRAFGGAIIFSLPLMMTMEMWWLGFYMERHRLILFVLLSLPFLLALSRVAGFENTASVWDDLIDVFVAYAVGLAASTLILVLFGVITAQTTLNEACGKILLQALPASIGALLARSQLGEQKADDNEASRDRQYLDELVIMLAGALFLAFNVAPTEEMILVSYMMTPWHALALLITTLLIMHAFTHASATADQTEAQEMLSHRLMFANFTCVGYLIALTVSAYMLWTFGRTTDQTFNHFLNMSVVLSFPAGVGAAASRLIL